MSRFSARLATALAVLFALLTPSIAAAQANATALEGIDQFMTGSLRRAAAPGAIVAIVKDGKVILSKGYGVRSLATGQPMNRSTVFPIQSQTKAFTALSAVMLRDEGKLDLDAPVTKYVPGLRFADPVATLEVSTRDLLMHRAGLGSYGWIWLTNDALTRADAMEKLAFLPPEAPIRTKFFYANMGYVTAARVVELRAGIPWERFVQERILAPLDMTHTSFSPGGAIADPDHIDGTMYRDGKFVSVPLQTTTPLTYSTGGLVSTADDMAKWMLFQLGGGRVGDHRIVAEKSIAETHEPGFVTGRPVPPPEFSSAAYGLGWFVESYRGEPLVEHGGGHWGVNSALGMLQDRQLGIYVFVNEDSDLAMYLMLSLADRFMAKGNRDWVAIAVEDKKTFAADSAKTFADRTSHEAHAPPPARPLLDYVGTYTNPGYGPVTVRSEGNRLVIQYDNDASALIPVAADVFEPAATQFGNIWAMLDNVRVKFGIGFNGKINSLRTNAAGDAIEFTKAG